MSVKLVTYDLSLEPTRDNYEELYLYFEIRDTIRLSESSYAIDTLETVDEIFANLRPALDPNDVLSVIPLHGPISAQHREDVITWLFDRLEPQPEMALNCRGTFEQALSYRSQQLSQGISN